MNIKQAKEEIFNAMTAYFTKDKYGHYVLPPQKQRPVFLMGPPGIGKTAIMEQVADEMGVGIVSYSMTHHTRQSALGLPFIVEKDFDGKTYSVSEYTMSEIIASVYDCIAETGHKEGILFLDEINCVSETLTPAMLQFLQYKTFGRHKIPNGWIVVTAGNPPEYNNSVREFDIVTWDRLKRIDIEPDYNAWKEYACQTGTHTAITTYLDYRNEDFYSVESSVEGKRFITARGWSDLSDMIKLYEMHGIKVTENLVRQYIQEPDIAKRFAVYYDLYKKYESDYKIIDILNGNAAEEIYNRAQNAAFDERVSLIGMLLDFVADKADDAISQESILKELLEVLRKSKAGLIKPGAKADEVLDLQIAELEDKAAKIEAVSGFSSHKALNIRALIEILNDYRIEIGPKSNDECFNAWKNDFDIRRKEMALKVKTTSLMLDNLFDFCEKVFESGQEMIILVTELTIRNSTAAFIARYGCDGYYRNNAKLEFSERGKKLLEKVNTL